MIVFCEANGQVTSVLPSPVYQGSALSRGLYFLAPFPKTNSVTVAFELPDGTVTEAYLLTPVIQGLENVVDTFWEKYSVWEWQTSNKEITAQAGTVDAQFYVGHYTGEEGKSEFQVQASAKVSFTVQKGVAPLPTETPSPDQWKTLISLYSEIKGTLDKIDDIDGKVETATTAAASATESLDYVRENAYAALDYKNAAETAANTATAKAQEASDSATAAAASATEAQSAANTATEKAAEATQAAENATAVTEQTINARIVQTTGQSTDKIMSQKAVTNAVKETKNNIADLKEALYGYVLDTAEVETDSVIPSTVEISGTTYNLVDGVRGLVKEIKGGTVNSDGLKSVEYTGLEIKGKNLLSFPYYSSYKTKNGITFSQVETYKVHASGINTLTTGTTFDFIYNKVFKAGTYTIKFYTDGNVTTDLYYRIRKDSYFGTSIGNDLTKKITFTLSEDTVLFIGFGLAGSNNPLYTGEEVNVTVYCQLELGSTATAYKPYREPVNILPFTTTLRGVDTYKDRIIITKNENDDYYTATKETNCEAVEYTSGDEDNVEYITDLTTTVKPLETPTTEVLSTTLTESDVMPLLELGGSVEIINENSLYVTGSTAIEMVYKLINNTATSEVTE